MVEFFSILNYASVKSFTPVVTFRRGVAPEVISYGETGFVTNTPAEFERYVEEVDKILP